MHLVDFYGRRAVVPACTAACALSRTPATNTTRRWPFPAPRSPTTSHPLPRASLSYSRNEHLTLLPSSPAEVCMFTGLPVLVTQLWAQRVNCNLATAPDQRGRRSAHPLLLGAAPTLSPEATLCCSPVLFCRRASANFHSVRTSKFCVCNAWLVKRK